MRFVSVLFNLNFYIMGTYNKGILGPFSGKVGTVIGATWRGKDYMRSLPKKTNRPATAEQLLQREKFETATDFLRPMYPVLRQCFGRKDGKNTRLNQALSYHMREALQVVGNTVTIDYPKVLIGSGSLLGVLNPEVTALGNNQLQFSWEDNANQGGGQGTDSVVIVVFAPTSKGYYTNLLAASRSALTATVTLPTAFAGETVHCWITFAANGGVDSATSAYLPPITVS